MTNVGEYAASAAVAVFQFGLFGLVGAVFGVFPRPEGLLTQARLKALSNLTLYLFFPSFLLATLGSTVTTEILLSSVAMIIWAIVHLILGLGLAYCISSLIAVPEHLRAAWMLAATFQNAGSMPLLLLLPLTASPEFARYAQQQADEANARRADGEAMQEPDSAEDMYARATTYIFLYTIIWQSVFWGIGYRFAEHDAILQQANIAQQQALTDGHGRDMHNEVATGARSANDVAVVELSSRSDGAGHHAPGEMRERQLGGRGGPGSSDQNATASSSGGVLNDNTLPNSGIAHEITRSESRVPLRESNSGTHLASSGRAANVASGLEIGTPTESARLRGEAPTQVEVDGAEQQQGGSRQDHPGDPTGGAGGAAARGGFSSHTQASAGPVPTQEQGKSGGARQNAQQVAGDAQSGLCGSCLSTMQKALLTPPVVAVAGGITIGLITPLSSALFEDGGSLKIFGDVMIIVGQPAIPASNVVLAGSVYHGIVAASNALGCGPWVRKAWQSCCFTRELARTSSESDTDSNEKEKEKIHPQLFLAGSVLCAWRLLGFPAIALGLYYLASLANSGLLGASNDTDPVLRMVIVTLGSVPSAQFCLMACSQLGLARASAELALVYAAMYPMSLLTLMLFLTLGMLLVFGS